MPKLNKRTKSAQYAQNMQSSFQCPICHTSMEVIDNASIVCANNHTFDFTKFGYVNFATTQIKTKYDKELFEARKKVITESPFFTPLIEVMTSTIKKYVTKTTENLAIIDMGCGEGSHLSQICHQLEGLPTTVVGIDLAKEGIVAAAKSYPESFWAVADIAQNPFQGKQFDIILNILSPSNYGEFHRLLKENGIVMKVVPQRDYLKELRSFFYDSEKQSYSNEDTVERFQQNFQIIDRISLCYTVPLHHEVLVALLQMTPLTWTATEEQIQLFLAQQAHDITVDLEILVGK